MDDPLAVTDGATSPVRPALALTVAVLAATVISADQATKYWVIHTLTENVPVPVIDGILQLRLIRNPGAAFSLGIGLTWVLTLIAATVSVVIIRMSRKLGSRAWAVALGLLLGGAMGNLVDRLTREPGIGRGHVVDFIEYLKFPFMDFPVFNVADSAIVVAAVLIGILGVRGVGIDGTRMED